MKLWKAAVAAATIWIGAGHAVAQPLAIGSNPPGSLFYAAASAIARVAGEKAGIALQPAPSVGSAGYIDLINGGKMAFGLTNGPEAAFAYAGTGTFEGHPHPNIRMICALFPTSGGFAVPASAPIRTVAELRGKRVPVGYEAGHMFQFVSNALLAVGGLTESDVTGVETANVVTAIKALVAGGTDTAYIPFNSRLGEEAMKSIPGGWRYLTFESTPAAVGKMWGSLPTAGIAQVAPNKDAVGVVENPTSLLKMDFVMLGAANVSPETVYQLVRTLHRYKPALVKSWKTFLRFNPRDMAPRNPVPYHPGAIKYFREIGILTE